MFDGTPGETSYETIRRQRNGLAVAKADLGEKQAEVERLTAENVKMRVALESIIRAECHSKDEDGNEEYCCCHDDAQTARNALAEAVRL